MTVVKDWYRVEVAYEDTDLGDVEQTVEGTGDTVGAWLRAMADRINPPRHLMRPNPGRAIDHPTAIMPTVTPATIADRTLRQRLDGGTVRDNRS